MIMLKLVQRALGSALLCLVKSATRGSQEAAPVSPPTGGIESISRPAVKEKEINAARSAIEAAPGIERKEETVRGVR
jgi:hypothetical protein